MRDMFVLDVLGRLELVGMSCGIVSFIVGKLSQGFLSLLSSTSVERRLCVMRLSAVAVAG